MGALIGKDLLVTIGGVPIAGQRECSLSFDRDNIDITCKTDWAADAGEVGLGLRRSVTGFGNWRVTAGGVIFAGDSAIGQLQTAMLNAATVTVQFNLGAGQTYSGEVHITRLEQSGSLGDVATYSCDFQGAGSLNEDEPAVYQPATFVTENFVYVSGTAGAGEYTDDGAIALADTPIAGSVTVLADNYTINAGSGDDEYTILGDAITLGATIVAAHAWVRVSYSVEPA
jgi:predicted secreted protein